MRERMVYMKNKHNDLPDKNSLVWRIRKTSTPPRWPGDKENLLIILHCANEDHPDLRRIKALCEPEYDRIRVVIRECFPLGEQMFLESNFRYDVMHLAPHSAVESGLVKWE